MDEKLLYCATPISWGTHARDNRHVSAPFNTTRQLVVLAFTMRRSAIVAALNELNENTSKPPHEPPRQLATGGGYGILQEQKPFKSPLVRSRNGNQSLRKRPRLNYAVFGDHVTDENDACYGELEEPRQKKSLEGVYKGIDASGVSFNVDRRKWQVYDAKPNAIKRKFSIPSLRNEKGELFKAHSTNAALGVQIGRAHV